MGFNLNGLSSTDLVWDKIQESRQNQTISFLIVITGAIFFILGFFETITSTGKPSWLLFIPYKLAPPAQNFVSLFMILCGSLFSFVGISFCIYYKFDREHYFELLNGKDVNENRYFSDRKTKAFEKKLIGTQNTLGQCKNYIMNRYNQNEVDSIYYCKLLGKHWHELVEEDELLSILHG